MPVHPFSILICKLITMNVKYILFCFHLIVLSACSKVTNCVNQIAGTWTISNITLTDTSGNEYDLLNTDSTTTTGFIEFTKYNTASPNQLGTLRQTLTVFDYGSQTLSQSSTELDYRLDEECTKILAFDSTSVDAYEYAVIIELSNSLATLQNADPSFGTVTTILTR